MDFLKLENHIFSTFTIICFNSRVALVGGSGEGSQIVRGQSSSTLLHYILLLGAQSQHQVHFLVGISDLSDENNINFFKN